MLSRSASASIATAYVDRFSSTSRGSYGGTTEKVDYNALYDYLYENEYEAWFCNLAQEKYKVRDLKEFFLKLHTGESIASALKEWSWEQRQKLGQRLLRDLAEGQMIWYESFRSTKWIWETYRVKANELQRRLELDGYLFKDGRLLQQQTDVLNVEEEKNILKSLYQAANLARATDAFQFLSLAEEHFISGRWSDTISNARKFFELTLMEGARTLGMHKGKVLPEASLSRPVEVRQYLESEGLLEKKERESFDKIYGLLSETGAHPYMAEADQARLLRQLSLTLAQFILLRLKAALAAAT